MHYSLVSDCQQSLCQLSNLPAIQIVNFWQRYIAISRYRLYLKGMDDSFDEVVNEDTLKQQFAGLSLQQYKEFHRKEIPPLNLEQELYMMQIDISYYTQQSESVLRMYGLTQEGASVLCHIKKFRPYFFVQCPPQLTESVENLRRILKALNEAGHQQSTIGIPDGVRNVCVVTKDNIRGFKGKQIPDSMKRYLKITTKLPQLVPKFRKIFEDRFRIQEMEFSDLTFQSNIPFVLRLMIDKNISGMSWLKICGGQYKHVVNKMSHCQIQIQCQVDAIVALSGDEWNKIAPLRIFSFDIECNPLSGFPSEKVDPIITIACVCKVSTEKTEQRIVLSLKECAPIAEVHVESFKKEQDMLLKFQKLLKSYDPDFIIGYNIINFDLRYIIGRAEALGLKNYGYFGRTVTTLSKIKSGKYLSKAMGMRDTKEINIEGRIQLDLMMHMHRQHKLSSYSLNNVSLMFLQERKEDVHHSQLNKLHNTSNESRKRIAIYCLKDAELPLKLMEKLMCLYNYTEMARVTGVPINFLFTRGQQIKVVSQLMRRAKFQGLLLPSERMKAGGGDDNVNFEGAYVIEPQSGFYTSPIATLDFASLYPSIMMAHNLCYTTLAKKKDLEGLEEGKDYVKTDDGFFFVKPHIHKGILPQILEELIGARKRAKAQLALATDEMTKGVLEGRQLALKISANSVYGFTGAVVGQLPCLEISSSVTSFGRQMIKQTKEAVMANFPNANVIYGDTDSVMVKFEVNEDQPKEKMIDEAMTLGRKAAETITKLFIKPIKLEFEKVYCPYLLVTKKRYAGLLYTKPTKPDKLDKKGIQSVRRDNCLLIRTMLEEVLKIIMERGSKEDAVKYIKQNISNLLQNKIDIGELVITKAITKKVEDDDDEKKDNKKQTKNTYKVRQAHVQLAEKMKKRDGKGEFGVGDRIPYVMIKGAKGSRNFENAEDPRKVLVEDMPIDFDYYIEKQIKPPLERLLKDTNIVPNFETLFVGEHTKNRYIPKIKNTSLGKFIVAKTRCMGCQIVSDLPICSNCEENERGIDIYISQKQKLDELSEKYARCWTQCQRCQGSDKLEIICENMDCRIFYKRIKVKTDLEEQRKVMVRFED